MNRINNYVLNGAIALLSTAGLVACSSSDDVTDAPVNPTYDGKSVKTQFAINIATPSNGKTRMSDVNTQNNNGNYLGMTNVRLLTLAAAPNNDQALLSALALTDPTQINTSNSSHIYQDVNIPLTTRNFLFYSTREGLGETITKKAETGAIVSDLFANKNLIVANTKDISFKSEPILSSTNTIIAEQTAFASYLNKVVGTQVDDNNKWSDAGENTTLGQAYKNFIKTYSTAQRAGSAEAVRLQMQALYNIAKPIADNSENTSEEALAEKLCENILNSSAPAGNSIKFKFTESNGKLTYYDDVATTISNFPCEQGLPEGAALLTWSGTSFAYNTNPEIGGSNKINISNITYPLPIVYFDNTPAKANNAEISNWQNTTSTWDTYAWNSWDDVVSATTRSIALQNNINYGVAGLKTVVKCEAAALEDNRNVNIPNSGNQSISVPSGGFEVTGILIGGQPNSVNWQFIDTNEDTREYVVYDKVTNGVKANASASEYSSDAIYTLVFDNWKNSAQEKVTFALELQNGDVEFYGQEGVIAAGQKFYLIGQLDPANPATGSSITWPDYLENYTGTDYTLPKSYENRYPVNAKTDRVFVQDFTTTARVNIKSLKNAYVTIPDLRATNLQLGLSVDLTWQTGLTFDVSID